MDIIAPVTDYPAAVEVFVNEYSVKNAGQVTLTGGGQELLELDIGSVSVGDRLLMNASCDCTKGGTSGYNTYTIQKKSGTAVLQVLHDRTFVRFRKYLLLSQAGMMHVSAIFRVTTAGTLILKFEGISDSSDSVCSAGMAQLYVNAMKQ